MMKKETNVQPSHVSQHSSNEMLGDVLQFLQVSRRSHYYCDDCWHTCPKHPEGCCDHTAGDACRCGADEYNSRLDDMIAKVRQHIT